jgi:class 3 adenylate cyclase
MVRLLLLLSVLIISATALYSQTSHELFEEGKEFQKNGRKIKAIRAYEDALTKAKSQHDKSLQMEIHLELAELKNNLINYKESLEHYHQFTALYKRKLSGEKNVLKKSVGDLELSVDNLETEVNEGQESIQKMDKEITSLTKEKLQAENEKQQLEIDKQQLEIDNKNQQLSIQRHENRRNIMLFIVTFSLLFVIFISWAFYRNKKINKLLRIKNDQIAAEKEKSEELLLNILPESIAEELKESGKTISKRYEDASIMFTDFKGFTTFSEQYSPEDLVIELDNYFTAFDEIMQKYNIEKIKTIGDAYLCVCGVPDKNKNHAITITKAAFELRDYVEQKAQALKAKGKPYLEMRIGIHSGPLVAGVVGSKKFAFDVWGDAVNIAARMEQSGEVNAINISEDVYQLIKDDFELEYRGEIEAKNKGKLKMYFVLNPKHR